MDELTKRQEEVLNFLKEFIVSHGYPPTVREIGEKLGLNSPATTHSHLEQLEKKGYIRKTGNKNRAIELLVDNERPNEFFSLPAYLIPKQKEVFTLKVSGESMINAGIFDGDIVIVERCNIARNGDIVVAMTDENEVTLKTFYKENGHFRLQPENDYMEPFIFENITILGKAIGLYRKL